MDPLTWQRMMGAQQGPLLTPEDIAMRLGASAVLGVVIALVYRRTQRDLAPSQKLVGALVMISMIVCLVLMVIDTSLARAFGLVGALAIIRFRTPVKDLTDIVFLFLSIGAGIAAGAGQFSVAFIGVPAILGVAMVVPAFGLDRSAGRDRLLLKLVLAPGEAEEGPDLGSVLEGQCESFELLEMHAEPGGAREVIYRVRPAASSSADGLVDALTGMAGVQSVVLLAPSHELDMR